MDMYHDMSCIMSIMEVYLFIGNIHINAILHKYMEQPKCTCMPVIAALNWLMYLSLHTLQINFHEQ